MRTSIIILCLAILGETRSNRPNPAFVNRIFALNKVQFNENKAFSAVGGTDEALQEAEEAAALDAHDAPDPGMEGAAMERSVILAAEVMEHGMKKEKRETKPSLVQRIWSLFHHDNGNEELETDADMFEASEAEAKYAHDLSDAAAMEHADETLVLNRAHKEKDVELDATEAEANYAHHLSDVAAMEHADETLVLNRVHKGKDAELDATEAEANYAHHLSDVAAMEHADETLVLNRVHKGKDAELDATEAEANYAHDLSDVAAMEHANEILLEGGDEREDEERT